MVSPTSKTVEFARPVKSVGFVNPKDTEFHFVPLDDSEPDDDLAPHEVKKDNRIAMGITADTRVDPFSDDHSLPDSPASPTSSTASHTLDPSDPLTPLKRAKMQCCHCPVVVQPLLSDYDARENQYRAVCENCTHALCKSCGVVGEDIITFEAGRKPKIPAEAENVTYYHFCMSCGRAQESSFKPRRMSGAMDVRGIECIPCNQKANSSNLVVASMVRSAGVKFSSPFSKQSGLLEPVTEDGDDPTEGGWKPKPSQKFLETGLKEQERRNTVLEKRRMTIAEKERRGTLAPPEGKRGSVFSLKGVKRWTSFSTGHSVEEE